MEKPIEINQEQIELVAESLARLLIQQVEQKKGNQINRKIENNHGKTN